jgi:hypothetical protein
MLVLMSAMPPIFPKWYSSVAFALILDLASCILLSKVALAQGDKMRSVS